MIDVVAAVIESKGRYLIARRATHKAQAGKWEFPGGKVEINETLSDALAREFSEEFGVSLLVGEVLLSSRHQYPEFEINLIALSATSEGEISASTDHDRLEWVLPQNLHAYQLCEADMPIAEYLEGKGIP
jgi:mutator protein MutT